MIINTMVCGRAPPSQETGLINQNHSIEHGGVVCQPGNIGGWVVPLLITLGIISGIIPHLPPVKRLIFAITDNLEEQYQEREIREYFERYP